MGLGGLWLGGLVSRWGAAVCLDSAAEHVSLGFLGFCYWVGALVVGVGGGGWGVSLGRVGCGGRGGFGASFLESFSSVPWSARLLSFPFSPVFLEFIELVTGSRCVGRLPLLDSVFVQPVRAFSCRCFLPCNQFFSKKKKRNSATAIWGSRPRK